MQGLEDLRGALPGRDVHVWNLSLAGVRASDVISLLQKAMEGRPDFIVIEGNYYISSAGGDPIAEPWLAYNLPAVPPSVAPLLPPRDAKKRMEDSLTAIVALYRSAAGHQCHAVRRAAARSVGYSQPDCDDYSTGRQKTEQGQNAALV